VTRPFEIARVFDAPRDRVWQAWTEPERMQQWFASPGMKSVLSKMDLRPGGMYHYCLRGPDGTEFWGRWIIREVKKPERLVFVLSFSDEKGGITAHPMSPTWPRQMLSTVTFDEVGKKTRVTVSWLPLEASELETKTFEDGRPGMGAGWGGTLDNLAQYLAK
jgi:uncharacterized protein YndB with AHSA1/START domain